VCTVILGLNIHPTYPFVIAANRDEFRARPTAPFGRLEGEIFGGRDLEAGGTWFATRPDGAMALLTNIRPDKPSNRSKKSRGSIVIELLRAPTAAKMAAVAHAMEVWNYNPFHALFGVGDEWYCLRGDAQKEVVKLAPGWHLLGNVGLDAKDDPKTAFVQKHLPKGDIKKGFEDILKSPPIWQDLGIYGSRWSMVGAGPELWISEQGINFAPLVRASLQSH